MRLKVATIDRLPSVTPFARRTRPVARIWKAPVPVSSMLVFALAVSHAVAPLAGSSSIVYWTV